MRQNLTALGHARVYRDPRSGRLVVDTDSLRRSSFAGQDFGDEYEGEDDVGDDDLGDEYEGEEDLGDDDLGEEIGRRRFRRLRRGVGRVARAPLGVARGAVRATRAATGASSKTDNGITWGMTAVGGVDKVPTGQGGNGGGPASVRIRLQHDFRAQDITFTGSVAGAKVGSILFGDRAVWATQDPLPVDVFASTSVLRGLLKGQSLKGGLDITVTGEVPTPGDFAVTLIGEKPVMKGLQG